MSSYGAMICAIFGILLIIHITDATDPQTKRYSRITSSRSFGTNVKQSSSNGVNFDCPEEFGYYPHPTDCTQYYVCVFGGALLESCTGGLMYSHELQTCDWPRNVGCEITDNEQSKSVSSDTSSGTFRLPQVSQQISHRVRFGSSFTTSTLPPQTATIPQQYHRQPSQAIQTQIQTLPPPPELRVAPNPVITSRGQPKHLLDSQEDIAKLYADAHDTLPPVEEEENDRQQRVYRGQPSTVGQVQRDRDGIIHQASINSIPNHGKVGSYAFGSHINQYRVETNSAITSAASVFAQPSQPPQQPQQTQKPQLHVVGESSNNNHNRNTNTNNRIYYNLTSATDQAYEPNLPQLSQRQQQSLPSQPTLPPQSSYDSYYSIYDDDVDLYRDVEYSNQQHQRQHQQQSQAYQPQQPLRSSNVGERPKIQQQPTYRPAEVLTTQSTPPDTPPRESYVTKPLSQKPHQQSLIYNSDYDEDLIAQIEQDNEYNQPTRAPVRQDRITIETINDRPIVVSSATLRTASNSQASDEQTFYAAISTREPVAVFSPTSSELHEGQVFKFHLPQSEQKNSSNPDIEEYSVNVSTQGKKPRPKMSSTARTTTQFFETTTPTPKSRTTLNSNRNRGGSHFGNQEREQPATVTNNRGTHPPRTRPTLKPPGSIVSKAQEFIDIYKNPPTRPDPLYPQPTPDKTAAKCRKDVCLLPDCYCGGKEIPGGLNRSETPQMVLITYDDAVSELNFDLYKEIFDNTRKNANGCPIRASFYVSHEWTDYTMIQDLYSDGHEIASHTVSHSFGEQFSQKKWTREVAGQREILAAYGGVKLSDVRGMRAPFLSVGGNKMYKMLYDSNFTYDSSMPVYENRPPSWPYTLDYKIFHDCMIPPCPTRSYPGVWQVPMVMWQDLNGGRCSMGDACSNPADAENVYKMIMKNFERHYTTNRAPFGLFYHAAWFTQPHHKEGFIKFLDAINSMPDVWIITNWQALQWVRDPTPISRINSFQPFQCDYSDRPKRCNNPKVCNLWHKSGVRYMKTCQPCPDIYPWTGKTGIRSSRIDNEIEEASPQ